MISKIKCLLDFHNWEYQKSDEWFDYRRCKNCKKEERMIRLVGIWNEVPSQVKKVES